MTLNTVDLIKEGSIKHKRKNHKVALQVRWLFKTDRKLNETP